MTSPTPGVERTRRYRQRLADQGVTRLNPRRPDLPRPPDPEPDPTWRDQAACKGASTATFFPVQGGGVEAAKKVCAHCPVTEQCLDYALTHHIRHGVWGGLSEPERAHTRRQIRGAVR